MRRLFIGGLVDAAIEWWSAKRPIGWSESVHLADPVVNCMTASEMELALRCAELVRVRLAKGDPVP